MQYQKPGFIMNLVTAEFDNDKAGTRYLLKLKTDTNRWLLNHLSSYPSDEQIQQAGQYVFRIAGISLSKSELNQILALYPLVRIELAVYGSNSLEAQHNLVDAISNFFLGCTWPRLNDKVDIESFISLLRRQATAMGYECNKNVAMATSLTSTALTPEPS